MCSSHLLLVLLIHLVLRCPRPHAPRVPQLSPLHISHECLYASHRRPRLPVQCVRKTARDLEAAMKALQLSDRLFARARQHALETTLALAHRS